MAQGRCMAQDSRSSCLSKLMAMAVPTCAASVNIVRCTEMGQPCVVMECSRSLRRRLRERRVAVRRAQKQAWCILEVLKEPIGKVQSELRAEAAEFIPSGVAVDCKSLHFVLKSVVVPVTKKSKDNDQTSNGIPCVPAQIRLEIL